MKSLGAFQAGAPALTSARQSVRSKTETGNSSQLTRPSFQKTFADLKPSGSINTEKVQVQRGDTLIGLTRKFMLKHDQEANATDVHRMAMSVAKNNSLANPNLIREGQTLQFPAAHFSGNDSSVGSSALIRTPTSKPETASRASLQLSPIPPSASISSGEGRKVAIVGDSIAVGIGGAMLQQSGITPEFAPGRKYLTQNQGNFAVNAVGGHSSPQILDQLAKHEGVKNAELAIISVGTNDFVNSKVNQYYKPERITQNLQRIRTELNAKERIWVLPYDHQARELVASVARERGDKTVDLAQFQQADRYHPRNYSAIANQISPLMNQLKIAQVAAPIADQQQVWMSTQSALLARGTQL